MMDFQPASVDIPVYDSSSRSYSEPQVSTNSAYNPFSDEYIDPTAPMPDVPFTGFDVPYTDTMVAAKPQSSSSAMVGDGQEAYCLSKSAGWAAGGSVVEYIDEEDGDESLFDIIESKMDVAESRTFGEVIVLPGGYAVTTYGGGGVVVALQRAYERVLYDDIAKSLTAGSAPTQRMFFAEELQLSAEEYELMESHATEFAALGFEVEYRGDGHIAVVGRPAILDMATPLDELLYELLHGIEDGRLPLEEERVRLAELMARRGARGYGRGVTSVEAKELLRRLEQCSTPSYTPSGAMVMVELGAEELKAKFMRN